MREGHYCYVQTGRATPVPTNSGARNSSRAHGPKAANGPSNKKRKHSASTSPSNSESQETPSSNASGCESFIPLPSEVLYEGQVVSGC